MIKNKNVIILDGPDRSGKGTFIESLNKFFEEKNIMKSNFKDDIWGDFLSKIEDYEGTNKNQIESCIFTQYNIFDKISSDKHKIIVDRGLLSTICYNELRLSGKRNKTNEEGIFILYDTDKVNDGTKEYYQEIYKNLFLIDDIFKRSSNILHVIMLPNIEEGKNRCASKREDEYDDIAKRNYDVLYKSYSDLSKITEIDTLIFDFNNGGNQVAVYLKKNGDFLLFDLIEKDKYNLEDGEGLKKLFYDFIKIHFN